MMPRRLLRSALGQRGTCGFRCRSGSDPSFALPLADGDLLLMDPPSQRHWQHALPQRARLLTERINLTFRVIKKPSALS